MSTTVHRTALIAYLDELLDAVDQAGLEVPDRGPGRAHTSAAGIE